MRSGTRAPSTVLNSRSGSSQASSLSFGLEERKCISPSIQHALRFKGNCDLLELGRTLLPSRALSSPPPRTTGRFDASSSRAKRSGSYSTCVGCARRVSPEASAQNPRLAREKLLLETRTTSSSPERARRTGQVEIGKDLCGANPEAALLITEETRAGNCST